MGYEYWPQALATVVRRVWEYTGGGVPILVTENGIATADDSQRIRFLHEALTGLHGCIADGIDVRGYTVSSFLDNFEWMLGYAPRFWDRRGRPHQGSREPPSRRRSGTGRSSAITPFPSPWTESFWRLPGADVAHTARNSPHPAGMQKNTVCPSKNTAWFRFRVAPRCAHRADLAPARSRNSDFTE